MNPYEELDVPTDATDEEIKSAYREKAQRHHPDRGGDEETFKRIAVSYDILSNSSKRRRYDRGEKKEQTKPVNRLIDLFKMVIEQNRSFTVPNLILASEERLDQTTEELKRKVLILSNEIKRLEKLKSRITTGGDNLFHSLIDQMVNDHRGNMQSLEEEIEVLKQVKVLLEAYDDKGGEVTWTTPSLHAWENV